jgi:hypothetical protein
LEEIRDKLQIHKEKIGVAMNKSRDNLGMNKSRVIDNLFFYFEER